MKEAKTCVLFMTHRMDPSILDEFQKIRTCQKPGLDIKLFYDKSSPKPPRHGFREKELFGFCSGAPLPPDTIFFDIASLAERFKFIKHWERGLIYGNTVFPVLDFALTHDYDFIWKIELDVRFAGDWKEFFDEFEPCCADLLGTTLCDYSSCPEWFWWQTLKHQGAPISENQRLRGFFPVLRLSKRACGILEEAYSQGWEGHYECVVPTVLRIRACSMEDIGGNGAYVPEGRKKRFYTNTPEDAYLWPGTFLWRVPRRCVRRFTVRPKHLYHPVARQSVVERFCHWIEGRKGTVFPNASHLYK
jgi:hypothetical protein